MAISQQERQKIEDLKDAIELKKKRIKRLNLIDKHLASGKNPGWKALKAEIQLSVESGERKILNNAKDPSSYIPDAVKFVIEQRTTGAATLMGNGIILNVEKASEKIAQLNDQIATDNQELRFLRDKGAGKETPAPSHRRGIV